MSRVGFASHTVQSCIVFVSHHLVVLFKTTLSPSVLYLSCCQTQALPLIQFNPASSLYLTILFCCLNYKIPIYFVSILLPNASFASHTVKYCTVFISHHFVVLFQLHNPHLFCICLVAKRRLCFSYCLILRRLYISPSCCAVPTTKSPPVLYLSCCQTQALFLILLNPTPSLYLTILLCCSYYKIPTCFVSIFLPNAGFASHTVKSYTVFVSHRLVVLFQRQNPHLFCIYIVAKRRLCFSYCLILHRLCISPSCCAVPTTKSPPVLYLSCCQTHALLLILLNPASSLYLTILLCCSNYKIPTCFVSVLLPNAGFASHTVKSCTVFVSHHLVVLFQLQNPHLFCICLVAKR